MRKIAVAIISSVLLIAALVVAPSASATHNPPYQARRTVFVHYGFGVSTPGSAWYNAMNARITYINSIGGQPIHVAKGACQVNSPCVEVTANAYGQFWTGIWVPGNSCNYAGTDWSSTDFHFHCKYDGTPATVGTIRFDTADPWSQGGREAVSCHELGHAWGLGHAGGTTCMQSAGDTQATAPTKVYANSETLELYDVYINHHIPP